jgi:ribosomal protein L37AE/L43A
VPRLRSGWARRIKGKHQEAKNKIAANYDAAIAKVSNDQSQPATSAGPSTSKKRKLTVQQERRAIRATNGSGFRQCPWCFLSFPWSRIDSHVWQCSKAEPSPTQGTLRLMDASSTARGRGGGGRLRAASSSGRAAAVGEQQTEQHGTLRLMDAPRQSPTHTQDSDDCDMPASPFSPRAEARGPNLSGSFIDSADEVDDLSSESPGSTSGASPQRALDARAAWHELSNQETSPAGNDGAAAGNGGAAEEEWLDNMATQMMPSDE